MPAHDGASLDVSSLDWRRADNDVFVATSAGEYAGFVSVTSDGAEAHSARGVDLGVHETPALARAAVVSSFAHPAPTPRGRISHLMRPLLERRRATASLPAARMR